MPAFRVIIERGQPPQAPTIWRVTTPSSTLCNTMSPPSIWMADVIEGRLEQTEVDVALGIGGGADANGYGVCGGICHLAHVNVGGASGVPG